MYSPNDFWTNLDSKNGPAKSCRFYVNITLPPAILSNYKEIANFNGRNYLYLQCEDAELPGKSIQTLDAKIYGPVFKVPYLTQYQDIQFTFISSNTFWERTLFDVWLEYIQPSNTNNMRFPKGDSGYMTTVSIIQFDENKTQIYASHLLDAFPTAVAAQKLSWGDANFHRASVQFAYQKYKITYDKVNWGTEST